MGLFGFFKGKDKKAEQTEVSAMQQEQDSAVGDSQQGIDQGGLVFTPVEPEGMVSLKLDENSDTSAILNQAVKEVLEPEHLVFQIAAPPVQEDMLDSQLTIEEQVAETLSDMNTFEIERLDDEKKKPEEFAISEREVTDFHAPEEVIAPAPESLEQVSEEYDLTQKEDWESSANTEIPSQEKQSFFSKLMAGLGKTRKNILGGVDAVLGAFTKIDEELFEELEEALIMADLGVATTMKLVDILRGRVKQEKITDPNGIRSMLVEEITMLLEEGTMDNEEFLSPTALLVIGVNGVGKTTTIGKLAYHFKSQGKEVLLAAADTFRAAAIDQLQVWGQRSDIKVIAHQENSDPAAVVFDAVQAAKARKADILLCDTAGRLHNKKNLMEELKKIARVMENEYPQAQKEVYLVLDATTGQNALQQAKLFSEVAAITGIILTKLDGTAKGGIVVAIQSELKIPVRYIGVGEGIEDLQQFHAGEFARALFGAE